MPISENLSLEYDENGMGNIVSKSGVGEKINYGEGTAGPNALTSIQNVETSYNPWPQTIGYNNFNKLSYMTDTINGGDSIQLSISYGFDNQRRKSTLSQPNAGDKTKYFFGDYEIITDDNGSKEFLFVNSPTGLCAIIENSNVSGTRKQKVWHTYTDHLGSLVYAVNADSTAEKREYSYDAWGNLRNHADWLDDDSDYDLIADRGYTGHEHLTEFGLINMNGRVYDPVVGRFLSPDPFVQKPGHVDGYNRYAYVSNNPLRYVDPTGYVFEREQSWGLWGIHPQRDSGHGKVGGGNTIGSSMSSAGGGIFKGNDTGNPYSMYTIEDFFSVGYYYSGKTLVIESIKYMFSKLVVLTEGYDYSAPPWATDENPRDIGGGGSSSRGGPGPEFSGALGDWLNKINHLGKRKWTDSESGTSFYIDDNGKVIGFFPISGIAPTPGKGLNNVSTGLKLLFKNGVKGNSIINIRSILLNNGFTQSLTRNKSGYLFTNKIGEQVRIMCRNGAWDTRIMNRYGNYLNSSGNIALPGSTHNNFVWSW